MSAQRDYYEVLGLTKEAAPKAIKDAFRTLALKFHPDRNKEPDAEEKFKEIAEAYAILSDPEKRADYDARGFSGVANFNREDLFGGINFEDIFSGLNFDWGGENPFEGFFHPRSHGPKRGANVEVDVYVSLERVAHGGEEEIRLTRPTTCPACRGSGEEGGAVSPACEACAGSGRITHSRREQAQHVLIQHITVCPACGGRGKTLAHPCTQCAGSGAVEQAESLVVKIPVGVEDGLVLRVPGKGMPSPDAGGVPGDLYAVIRTKPDARFERVGADLLRQEVIAVTDAVLGTHLTVPTLDSTVSVVVPPGTQPDAMLRLKKKGLPAYGKGSHGDLYLRIKVRVPKDLTHQERELYEKLQALGAAKQIR